MENVKEKVYMVCDWHDGKAEGEAMDIGVEYMGNCTGRIIRENGTEIGRHWSSTFGWLRHDLLSKIPDPSQYEIIDLIGQEVPEQFKLKPKATES